MIEKQLRSNRPRRRHQPILLGLTVLVIALTLTACGSSKSKSSTATTAATTATTAASSSATTGSSSATTAASGGGSGLAAAEAFVAKASVQPTAITDTAKVTGTIPKGKLIYFIPCGPNPECQQEGQIVKQADTILGWKTVIAPNDGSPQGSKAAFDQVVRAKANAVLYTAISQATFQSEIPALKANGTVVATCCVTDSVGTGIDYAIDVPDQVGPVGGAQAAFVAANSKCSGDASVVVNIPDLQILTTGVTDYKSGMQQYCPGASVATLNVALADIGTATTTIVSYVRAHPSVKYVVASTDGLTIGLPAALKAAGLTSVKLVGQGATPTNIQYLRSGQEAADVAFPYDEVMWAMVTAVAQKLAGGTITSSVAPPLWLLTPTNAPNTSAAIFPVVANYQSEYKALWGLG